MGTCSCRPLPASEPGGRRPAATSTSTERYDPETLHAALTAAPDSLLTESFLWGTPATIAAKVEEFTRAGLRHIILSPVSSALSGSATLTAVKGVRSFARMLAARRPADAHSEPRDGA